MDWDNSNRFGYFVIVIDRKVYVVIWSEYRDYTIIFFKIIQKKQTDHTPKSRLIIEVQQLFISHGSVKFTYSSNITNKKASKIG